MWFKSREVTQCLVSDPIAVSKISKSLITLNKLGLHRNIRWCSLSQFWLLSIMASMFSSRCPVCLFKDEARSIIDHLKEKPHLKFSQIWSKEVRKVPNLKSRIESGQFALLLWMPIITMEELKNSHRLAWRNRLLFRLPWRRNPYGGFSPLAVRKKLNVFTRHRIKSQLVAQTFVLTTISSPSLWKRHKPISANFGCVHPYPP